MSILVSMLIPKKSSVLTGYSSGGVAADKAVKNSELDLTSIDLERCGTVIGSGIGGLSTLETEHTKFIHTWTWKSFSIPYSR